MSDEDRTPHPQPTYGDSSAPWWSPAATVTVEPPPPNDPPAPATIPPGSRPPRAGRLVAVGAVALAVALGSGLAGAELAMNRDGGSTPAATVTSGTVVKAGSTPTETLAKVAAAVQPTVVSITVTAGSGSDEGSGVIMSSDGTILTNNHVISAAAEGGEIEVTFADGSTATASIVGRDASTDLAVIKAAGVSGLTPATFGDSDSVDVGEAVLAIGSPLGLEGSVTSGIVSALHRPVETGAGSASTSVLSDAIQTDAAINPGNSGGPLVDASGAVIGINSAIAALSSGTTGQSGSIGVGFAIPIDEASRVAKQLIAGDTVTHAVLGVQVSDVSGGGARIEAVTDGSGADDAGIQAGDVVTHVDGTSVEDATALTAAVRAHQPGDKVRVTLTRAGRTEKVTVTLGSAS